MHSRLGFAVSKLIKRSLGMAVILIGVVLFILPIPVGWLVIGIGVAVTCGHDFRSLHELVEDRRSENRWLDNTCRVVSSICPGFLRRWLNRFTAKTGS